VAYIPTTPIARLPVASPSTPWWGSSGGGYLGAVTGVADIVTTSVAGRRAGLRGASLAGPVVHSVVNAGLSLIPGVNLLAGFASLVGLAFRGNLEDYQRIEQRDNPGYLNTGSTNLAVELQRAFDENPGQAAALTRTLNDQQRARAAFRDPRTGAGISHRSVDLERNVLARQSEVRRAEGLQRVAFGGVPAIFSRNTRRVN